MEIRWDVKREEWDRRIAAESAGGCAPLQQDWSYGDAVRMLGGASLRAVAEAEGRALALAQFTMRPIRFVGLHLAEWALCARGPVWLNAPSEAQKAEIYRRLKAEAPLSRRRAIFFSPEETAPTESLRAAGLRRIMTGYSTAVLDLDQDLTALEGAMRGKWRNRLRASEKADLLLEASRPKVGEVDWLLERETAQRGAKGYQGLPTSFVTAYQLAGELAGRLTAPRAARGGRGMRGALRLFRAQIRGSDAEQEPAAAMLVLTHGRGATYHIGWSSPEGRRLGAHNALLWRAVKTLKSDGVRSLDLGGVDTERGVGLARFKLGSGAAPLTLCGTYF